MVKSREGFSHPVHGASASCDLAAGLIVARASRAFAASTAASSPHCSRSRSAPLSLAFLSSLLMLSLNVDSGTSCSLFARKPPCVYHTRSREAAPHLCQRLIRSAKDISCVNLSCASKKYAFHGFPSLQ